MTKNDSAPGLIAIILFIALLLLICFYWSRTRQQKSAISGMSESICAVSDIEAFAEKYAELCSKLSTKASGNKYEKALLDAWDGFRETIVPDDIDGPLGVSLQYM